MKFVHGWFVTKEMLEKLGNVVFSYNDIDLDGIDSHIVNEGIGLATIDLNNINAYDYNSDENDSTNIVLVRLTAWCTNK